MNTYREPTCYMDCHFNMGKDKMANVLYAVIMCQAKIVSTFTLSKEYSRKQNTRNGAWVKVHLEDRMIPKFEELSGIKLEQPERVGINAE